MPTWVRPVRSGRGAAEGGVAVTVAPDQFEVCDQGVAQGVELGRAFAFAL